MLKGYDILVGTRLNSPLLSWEWEEGLASLLVEKMKPVVLKYCLNYIYEIKKNML